MQRIAPGLGRHDHQAGRGAAELGIVVLAAQAGFRDRIERRVDDYDAQDRVLVVGSVQLETGAGEMLSVHLNLQTALRVLARRMIPTQALGSGCKQLIGLEVAVEGRQVFQLMRREVGGNLGAIRLQQRRHCGDFDLLRHLSDLHSDIHAGGLVYSPPCGSLGPPPRPCKLRELTDLC